MRAAAMMRCCYCGSGLPACFTTADRPVLQARPQNESADTRRCVALACVPCLHVCLYTVACLHFAALCLLVIQVCVCRQCSQECSMQQPPTATCTSATKAHTCACRVPACDLNYTCALCFARCSKYACCVNLLQFISKL